MNIAYKLKNPKRLSEISIGDVFMLNNKIYMKTNDMSGDDATCVCMNDGELNYFYIGITVEMVDYNFCIG